MDRKRVVFEICPLRSLDEFLLGSARFQIPNMKDPNKWAKRVIHNLLYFQTNYFLMGLLIFLTVGVFHPVEMFDGMMAITIALCSVYYAFSASESIARMKSQYPIIRIILLLIGICCILYMMGSVIVFLMGVLLPVMGFDPASAKYLMKPYADRFNGTYKISREHKIPTTQHQRRNLKWHSFMHQ